MKILLMLLLIPMFSFGYEEDLKLIEDYNRNLRIALGEDGGYDHVLMDRVCSHGRINGMISPICGNRELFNKSKASFESRGVPHAIALGIMLAESHIGVNYAGTCNQSWNNWGGIKRRLFDDGSRLRDQIIPNNGNNQPGGCWLYKFNSIEDYFESKANTLGIGYKTCFSRNNPIRCISYAYVGRREVAEVSRINNVKIIAREYN